MASNLDSRARTELGATRKRTVALCRRVRAKARAWARRARGLGRRYAVAPTGAGRRSVRRVLTLRPSPPQEVVPREWGDADLDPIEARPRVRCATPDCGTWLSRYRPPGATVCCACELQGRGPQVDNVVSIGALVGSYGATWRRRYDTARTSTP